MQTGAVLIVLLAVLGVTILRIGQLTWLHLFLGLLLIGPVALKIASTGYRFVRYYTGDPAYLGKGPPPAFLRMLGPVVVLSTIGVFATGVVLLALGPASRSTWLLLHKVFFFAWLAATALHVLGHLPEIRRGLIAPRAGPRADPRGGRNAGQAVARRPPVARRLHDGGARRRRPGTRRRARPRSPRRPRPGPRPDRRFRPLAALPPLIPRSLRCTNR